MMDVLGLLNGAPSDRDSYSAESWYLEVEGSLRREPEAWRLALDRHGRLIDSQAWSLLGWAEMAATQVVRQRSAEVLTDAAFAMALVVNSVWDRRDWLIVAALLHRASVIADLPFDVSVVEGCERAGENGQIPSALMQAPSVTPTSHVEVESGSKFSFRRIPMTFDALELEHWLDGEA
jgi:hypothetical protein